MPLGAMEKVSIIFQCRGTPKQEGLSQAWQPLLHLPCGSHNLPTQVAFHNYQASEGDGSLSIPPQLNTRSGL